MKVQFTNHILYESALRIEDEEIKKDILKIKEYFEDMFHKMWDFWYYKGQKMRMTHCEKDEVYKMQAGSHKLIFKRKWEEFLLITYARKKDFDIIENKILRIIRNTKWKKK